VNAGVSKGVISGPQASQPGLRVWVVHNAYQQRGGEDSVMEAEVALLREHGHHVETWVRHNDEVTHMSRLKLAAQTLWSTETTERVASFVDGFRPDVIHVHNTLPLVSPSVFWAAERAGVPIVQTLHNFRLMCPQATFLRDGRVCEDCVGRVPLPAIRHRCYRDSAVQTAAVSAMLVLHRSLGTFDQKVTRFIALNRFCRDKFVQGGLPAERIDIKPNFVHRPLLSDVAVREGGLYVGRLSVEKGMQTLIDAMRLHPGHGLKVAGSGPLEASLRDVAPEACLGALPLDQVMARLQRAAFLVLPSVWYECFPRVLVEAFACGVPVIASRLGSLAEIVDDGRTGLLFEPGNPAELADRIRWAQAHPQEMARMGEAARAEYEAKYNPEENVGQLTGVYRRAMADVAARRRQHVN
jgi:glycosyltransferase involved in cell wall biosynthesis